MSGAGCKQYAYYISVAEKYSGREFNGIDYDYVVPAGTPPESAHDTLMYVGHAPKRKRTGSRRRTPSPTHAFGAHDHGGGEDDAYGGASGYGDGDGEGDGGGDGFGDGYAYEDGDDTNEAADTAEYPTEMEERMAEEDAGGGTYGVPDIEIYLGPSSEADLSEILDDLPKDAATADELTSLRRDMKNGEQEFRSVAAQLAGMPHIVVRFIRTFVRIVRSNLNSVMRYFIQTEAKTAERQARQGEAGEARGATKDKARSFADWVWGVVKLGGTALKRLWTIIKWVGKKTFQLARFMSRHPKIVAVLIRIGLVVYSQLCKRMSWWCVTNKSCMELTGLEKEYRVKRSIGGRAKEFVKDNAQEIAAVLLSGIQAYAQVALQPMVDATLLFFEASLPAFAVSGGPVTAFLAPIMGLVLEYLRAESVAVVETILVSMAVGSSMGELYIALSSECLKQPVIVETDGRLWGADRRECDCDADCRGNGDMTKCAEDGYCWTEAKVAAEGYWGLLKYHVGM